MSDTTTKTRKADYEITACDTPIDFDDKSRYKKVDADDPTMAAFFHSIPTMLAADTMAKAYLVKFPEGLPHTLLKFRRFYTRFSAFDIDIIPSFSRRCQGTVGILKSTDTPFHAENSVVCQIGRGIII